MPSIAGNANGCISMIIGWDTIVMASISNSYIIQTSDMEGESRELVEEGQCGLCVEPENETALAKAQITSSRH